MTTYNTGNPLGSAAAKDLFDNAQNLDFAVNSITQIIWSDRFGKNRKTFWGMEQDFSNQLTSQEQRFNNFIQNSGYKVIGDYEDGPMTITEYNQLIRYGNELWKITAATDIPYTTTGADAASWVNDSVNFVSVGDGALRQQITDVDSATKYPELQIARWRDEGDVRGWGATGDGVTDDTVAIQSCFTSRSGKSVNFPSGKFVVKGTLYKDTGMIVGQGRTTVLIFDDINGSDGIVFTPTNTQSMAGASSLTILAKTSNGGRALSVPQDQAQYFTYRTVYNFSDLYVSGYTIPEDGTQNAFETVETWLCGIETGDGVGCYINNYQFYGNYRSDTDPSSQDKSCAIRLKAAFTLLTSQISSITLCNVYRGIEIGNYAFWQISKFDIAHAYDGIYQIDTALNECTLTDGNINAQNINIYFYSIGGRRITNVICRRHRFGWKSATNDWYGIKLVSCNSTWITNFEAEPSESNGAFLGNQYCISLDTCGGVMVDGVLVGATCDFGIHASNTAQLVVSNTETFQNASNAILFNLVANTRNMHIGNYALVSSFAGTVLNKDSTIVNPIQMINQAFDWQTSGSQNASFTRSNATTDNKRWSFALGTTSFNRQVVSDAGSGTNFELVTRTGTTVDEIQWRATQLRINNAGPIIRAGSGSPEGVITAPPGSLWLNTTSGGGNYQKLTGSGNTGWVAI